MNEDGAIYLPGHQFGVDQIRIPYSVPPLDGAFPDGSAPTIRCFLPPDMMGGLLTKPYLDRLEAMIDTHPEHDRRLEWIETRLLYDLAPFTEGLARRERRHLNLRGVEKTKTYRRLARLAQARDSGLAGIRRIAGPVHDSNSELMERALYRRPDVDQDWGDVRSYLSFRSMFLQEFVERQDEVRALLSDNLRPSGRSGAVESLLSDFLLYGPGYALTREGLQRARNRARKDAKAFSDLAMAVRQEMDAALSVISSGSWGGSDLAGTEVSSAHLQSIFTPSVADGLLSSILQRYIGHFRVPVTTVIPPAGAVITALRVKRRSRTCDKQTVDIAICQGIVKAIKSQDIFDKWNQLGWLLDHVAARPSMVDTVYLEAELTKEASIAHGLERIYRLLAPRITRQERRLFGAMYLQLPGLDYEVACRNPIAMSFVFGTDGEALLPLLNSIVYPRTRIGKYLRHETEAEWRAYVSLYRYLADEIRNSESDWKKRKRRGKTQFADFPIDSHLIPEPTDTSVDNLRSGDGSVDLDFLEQVVSRVCNPRETSWILKEYVGITQEEIAKEAGVTQARVSQVLAEARRKFGRHIHADREGFRRWRL